MMNIALPEIMRDFGVSLSEVKLVVLAYLLVITSTLVFWGRVADKYGKGWVYIIGMTVFIFGALACSLSPAFYLLISARCVQAIGAAMMMSSGPAILKITTPPEKLGKTLGLVGVATSCGLMSGPLVCGLILDSFSWREVFLVSVPLGTVVVGFGFRLFTIQLKDNSSSNGGITDMVGVLLWIVLAGIYVILLNGDFSSWWLALSVIVGFFLLLSLFLKIEKNAVEPILPLFLVRRRFYWTSVSTAAISFASLFIVLIMMPFYLEYILEYTSSKVGLTMMALPVSLIVMSPLSGWLYDRFESARFISTMGLGISCLAVFWLLSLTPESSMSSIGWRLMMLGAGQSIFLSPNSASVLKRVEDKFAGITSGILATARNFGMLTGATLAGTCFTFLFSNYTGGLTLASFRPEEHKGMYLLAQQNTLHVAIVLLICAIGISLLRSR